MGVIDSMLSALGENFVLIVTALVELLVAMGLAVFYFRTKRSGVKRARTIYALPECSFASQTEVLVVLRSTDRLPLYISDNFDRVLGLSMQAFYDDIESLDKIGEANDVFKRYTEWDGSDLFCYTFRLADGERWMKLSAARDNITHRDILVFSDITEYKLECSELDQKIKVAEEESLTKSQFLSRMSHEIRTPMNGIIGMLSLAEKQCADNAQLTEYLGKADVLSQYLLSIINDILDLSRIEAGKLELEAKPMDLRNIAEKLRNMFKDNVESKGVRFEVSFQDFDTYCLVGDETRLSQVLINFVSNAVKFTSSGEITITFRQMFKKNGKVDFMVKVHDTGTGIKPDFLNKIFRPFEQESANISNQYGGSGLGMAITDNIVRIMGGNIVINSMPGQGSDFNVFLSLPEASEQQTAEVSGRRELNIADSEEFSYSGKRILLAEDNDINAEITVDILESEGAKVDVAANGQIAVDMFEKSSEGYYDFILMDVQMPVLNGRDAAVKIRKLDRSDAKKICIFALSADAFVEDKRRSIEIGMDGHFSKPVDFNAMKESIGNIMKRKGL